MRTILRALALASVLTAALGAPVLAADPAAVYQRVVSSANPAAAYAALSKADRAAFKLWLTPAQTVVTSSAGVRSTRSYATAAGVQCKTQGNAVAQYNMWGGELWQWDTVVEWCFNGAAILYSDVRTQGHVYVPFWSWGNAYKTKALNIFTAPMTLTVQTGAEFKLCLFGDIGCTNYLYPWFNVKVYGNGTSSWAGGRN